MAFKQISASDVAGTQPGTVYYAYDPATDTYWAMANFDPSSTAPMDVVVDFQDGGSTGLFQKAGAGPWQVQLGSVPPICAELRFFPSAILAAWSMPTAAPTGVCC